MLAFHCQSVGEAKLSAHSFRKYFQTQLEAAGVSPNWIDQMIGHRLINSRDSYSLPSDQQLREAYEKAYPQLRIYPEEVEVEERISKLEAGH
jgi:site-specific recombinase XerD